MSHLTIGQFLKKARIEKGLTIKETSEKTKINQSLILNFERDNFDQLPNFIYLKCFLKQLAPFLDIDLEIAFQLLKEAQDQYAPFQKFISSPVKPNHFFHLAKVIASEINWRFLFAVSMSCSLGASFFYVGYIFIHSDLLNSSEKLGNRSVASSMTREIKKELVRVKIIDGECTLAYKIDSQPLRKIKLSKKQELSLEGHLIRLSIDKPENVELRSQNSMIALEPFIGQSGAAHIVFPNGMKEKYPTKLYVFK